MDGFLSAAMVRLPVPDTRSVIEDTIIQSSNLANFLATNEGRVIAELIGEGQFNCKLAEEYRLRYFNHLRFDLRKILEKGIQRGELKKDIELELCIDLLYGPIFY